MYKEEDFLSLSGIQHFAFCRRQWALIHIEQQWQENLKTIEGAIMHEKAHELGREKRGAKITTRGLPVFSYTLGVCGVCDVVEMNQSEDGVSLIGHPDKYIPVPIEYKRGKPKENSSDALQLCAQAICLEEMLLCPPIKEGYLYYGETRHRLSILLDQSLRAEVQRMFAEMHHYYSRKYTPKMKPGKHCSACSLADICMPKLNRSRPVNAYIESFIKEEGG